MEFVFLGSGSAFTVGDGNWQSNMLIEAPSGKKMLVDCGSDIRFSLAERGLGAADIDAVYISHLHADHVGGMEWLGFSTCFNPACVRPRVFGGEDVVAELWEHSLAGGMQSIQGRVAALDTYFDVRPVASSGSFEWEGVVFHLIKTTHVDDGMRSLPTNGLRFLMNGKTILLTADTQHTPNKLAAQYASADIIFHDCETSVFPSGVHAHYRDLRTLPEEFRSRMWLYHFQAGPLPDAAADGFLGFVTKGQVFR
ncbi:MAG: ribonuclease Z [Alphaproteobacteria bacterium]|nr:ribonuclease Z [Alphaproteobacteria bacterium]